MPRFRVTYFYEQQGAGWSESIHTLLLPGANLTNLIAAYVSARMQIANPSVILTHIRISDDDVFRDFAVPDVAVPQSGQFKKSGGPAGGTREFPSVAALLRIFSGNTIVRNLFVRGLPDDQNDGNEWDPGAQFNGKFATFRFGLQSTGWAINHKDATQPRARIKSMTASGVVEMIDAIPGLALSSTIQLMRVPRSVIPGRFFRLSSFTDEKNFTLAVPPNSLEPLFVTGVFRRVAFVLHQIDHTEIERVTERRTGRPFGVLRGRAAPVR